jgi:hypothetical protein
VAPSGPFQTTVHGNRAIAKSGSVDWVDPFIGARVRQQLAAWPGDRAPRRRRRIRRW